MAGSRRSSPPPSHLDIRPASLRPSLRASLPASRPGTLRGNPLVSHRASPPASRLCSHTQILRHSPALSPRRSRLIRLLSLRLVPRPSPRALPPETHAAPATPASISTAATVTAPPAEAALSALPDTSVLASAATPPPAGPAPTSRTSATTPAQPAPWVRTIYSTRSPRAGPVPRVTTATSPTSRPRSAPAATSVKPARPRAHRVPGERLSTSRGRHPVSTALRVMPVPKPVSVSAVLFLCDKQLLV